MKLVQQAVLVFGDPPKEKIYEVDLCEVGTGSSSHVVNFRYGRRGSPLKEGSKTPVPVSLSRAKEIFDELVATKVTSGYRPAKAADAERAQARSPARLRGEQRGRAGAVLAWLTRSRSDIVHQPRKVRGLGRPARRGERWPLDRVIWRAGELRLAEAVPRLLELYDDSQTRFSSLRTYTLLWALGRCAPSPAPHEVLTRLDKAQRELAPSPMLWRVATVALLQVAPPEVAARVRGEIRARLPAALQSALAAGSQAFTEAFAAQLLADRRAAQATLVDLYLLDEPVARAALLSWLREVPLEADSFRAVRHLFKAAEQRLDAEVFGVIAWRLETSPATFGQSRYNELWCETKDGKLVRIDGEELARDDARFAFGSRTRTYLRRRVWRTLRGLGTAGRAEEYVSMAVGVLLPWQDEGPGSCDEVDAAARWAFGHVLFGRTKRASARDVSLCWRWQTLAQRERDDLKRRRALGHFTPHHREEAFPELWDACPRGLLHLLDESRSELVHVFAARALVEHRARLAEALDADALEMLLECPYPVTARVGFEFVADRHEATAPDLRLVLAVANCAYAEGRKRAWAWIEAQSQLYLASAAFVSGLVASPRADTRAFARQWLTSRVFGTDHAQQIFVRLVAMVMGAREPEDAAQVADIATILSEAFARELAAVGEPVLRDLLAHPLEGAQSLAGTALVLAARSRLAVPEELLASLLESEHEAVRALGLRVLDVLDEARLAARPHLLVVLTLSGDAQLREGSRTVIERLVLRDVRFAGQFLEHLIDALVRRRAVSHGVGPHLVWLFGQLLEPRLGRRVAPERVQALLRARSPVAQELGGLMVARHLPDESLSVGEMARLATHAVFSVREAGWAMMRRNVARLRADMVAAVRVFDTRWDDTLSFAFELFGSDAFSADDFTPQVLIGIVDSPRPEVQHFGQQLLTRYFPQAHGVEVMTALGEHPSANVQLLVTNYLERFASGRLEVLRSLVPYFRMALSRVNRGALTRARLYRFLEAQALQSEAIAALVAELMVWHAASVAIESRAQAVAILTSIARRWPAVDVVLQVREPEVRGGV